MVKVNSCKNHLNISLSVSDGALFFSCLLFFRKNNKIKKTNAHREWARQTTYKMCAYNVFFSSVFTYFLILMYYCDRVNSCFLLLKYLFGSFLFCLLKELKFSFLTFFLHFPFYCNYLLWGISSFSFFLSFFLKNSSFLLCNWEPQKKSDKEMFHLQYVYSLYRLT